MYTTYDEIWAADNFWSYKSAPVLRVFQATFDYETLVTGITTQGRGDAAQWVTSFTLEYSADDGATYTGIPKNGADVVCVLVRVAVVMVK